MKCKRRTLQSTERQPRYRRGVVRGIGIDRWIGVVALASALVGCGEAAMPAPLTGAVSVSLSSTHACALLEDGSARCWGEDVFGQLGDGQMTFAVARPVVVSGLSGLAAVVAGFGYSCGLVKDGAVACWGNDIWDQIGDETGDGGTSVNGDRHVSVSAPTGVNGLGPVVDGLATAGAADSGGAYTCAHTADETVQCWGENAFGLGGPTALGMAPASVPGLLHVRAMALGGSFGCFALDDGTVDCLGLGPLGQGKEFSASDTPVAVAGLSGVTGIAAGTFHACALIDDGTVQCWGDWGGPNPTPVPVAVDGLSGVTAVAAGGFQTCALLGNGGVTCWGNTRSATPKRVAGLGAATAISVGGVYACAVIKGGTIQCWGDDSGGLLGDGVSAFGNAPRSNVPPVSVVAADGGV
jgi:alpha-tubulin suppressor-like RCC1 family protein